MTQSPRTVVFPLLLMLFCGVSLRSAEFSADDWKRLQTVDTLDLYSDGNYAGMMIHILAVDDSAKTVVNRTRLALETSGLSAGETVNMELNEERKYGFDGSLLSADQEMKSPAGTTTWKLARRDIGGWALSVTAGGTTRVRKMDTLSENIMMMYRLYSGMQKRTVKPGEVLYDTTLDLASGQVCFTRVVCGKTPSVKNGFRWVFTTFNNLTARGERWELDTSGNTVFQENFPYVLRRHDDRSSRTDRGRASALFETFSIPVQRAATADEAIVLVLDSSLVPDSSVSRFYAKNGGTWVLRNVSAVCPERPFSDSGDSTMGGFTAPTPTMQSDDRRIAKLADSLVKSAKDRCDSIRACFEYVNKTLNKRYSPAFSNALETLAAGYGDCGEHAVLLGALLRAVRVPARVALGLVYMGTRKGYLFHAWVMAYAGKGRWVFVDPALGVFPATRDRVPLVIDDTGSASMNIAKMLGRIKIEYVKK